MLFDQWIATYMKAIQLAWIGDVILISYIFTVILFPVVILMYTFIKINAIYGIFMTIMYMMPSGFNILLKDIIGRSRPDEIYALVQETGYSMPSTHTVFAITFYGFLLYFINKTNITVKYQYELTFTIYSLICYIILSRVYLGVHWVSDILVGVIIGIIYLVGAIWLYKRIFNCESV